MNQEQVTEAPEEQKIDTTIFDTREVSTDIDGTSSSVTKFDFLVIDKAEKWKPAKDTRYNYKLKIPGQSRIVIIPVRGISWGEWEEIEMRHPMPEQDQDSDAAFNATIKNNKEKEFSLKLEEATYRRYAALFELSTGNNLPGDTIEEKVSSVRKMLAGTPSSFFSFIMDDCSNLRELDGPLIRSYKQSIDNGSLKEVQFTGFQDFFTSGSIGSFLQMQRPLEDFIVEIPLKSISDEDKRKIDDAVQDPVPPSRPGKNPITGKIDPNTPVYSYNEPRYKEALRAANRVRLMLKMEAALPFKIPGSNHEEKFKWIAERLLGDVYKLNDYITNNVMGYGARMNFF